MSGVDARGSGLALCSTCHLPLSHPVYRCECMSGVEVEVIVFLPPCPICRTSARVTRVQPDRGTNFGAYYRCSSGPDHPVGSLGEPRPIEFIRRRGSTPFRTG